MILQKTEQKVNYFRFNNLSVYEDIIHFVTTRQHGFSQPPFDSLNLGLKVNDDKFAVIKNRSLFAGAVGLDIANFSIPSQCHSNRICIVDEKNMGMGIYDNVDAIADTDALICNKKGICLLIFAADCVPIILFDSVQKIIAVAHAGWKGTVNNIVKEVVLCMSQTFKTKPTNIIAGIGPSIGPCCYNIGDDVILKVKQAYTEHHLLVTKHSDSDMVFFDLWTANKINLINAGVCESNIEVSEMCTSCQSDLFFSHRKSGGKTGRFGAGIYLK